MSGHASGSNGKVTLTLWVHEASQAPGTQQSTSTPSGSSTSTSGGGPNYYGVPLASPLSSEVVLSPELLKNEILDVQIGDVVELVKASSYSQHAGNSNGNGNGNGLQSGDRSTSLNHEALYKQHHRRHRRPSKADTIKLLPNPESLVFRIERSSLANEGSSGQLQISISQTLAQAFELKNRDQIILRKLPSPLPKEYIADHVELYFKDQYLGRADMHRISLALADSCLYKEQKVQLAGLNIRARIGGVWVGGKQRKAALFTSDTKTVFRSESAKYYIFIQLSKEMWMFDDDGSLFFEKAVDLFLPELFSRWEKKGTNHIVSIVLFSRIIYDKEEVEIVDRPLMAYDANKTDDKWTDVYKVIVDLETNTDWSQALHSLRKEFQNFRQDVLLRSMPRDDGKLAGKISAAHEGGILEAINMALSAFDKHYVDRDLQRTGLSVVIITAGTSHFNVDKNLLRLTTERMIDEGVGVDCVSLAKMPLHAVPLFKYMGTTSKQPGKDVAVDHLYVEDDPRAEKDVLYTIPYWVDSSFYAKHQDKPFRCDRFLPRCRMPSITSIGIAEYENANITIPSISEELRVLEGYGPEWEQLSKREKLHKQWEQFDSIACGALGKWQLLDLKERKHSYAVRQTRRAGSLATPSSSSLGARSQSIKSKTSSGGSGSDRGGSETDEELSKQALTFRRRQDRGRTMSSQTKTRPSPLEISGSATQDKSLPDLEESPIRSQSRTRESSVSTVLSKQVGPPRDSSHARSRADSSASLSTISRARSSLNIKSPSVVTASRAVSGAHAERRVASSSASSTTAVERAQPAIAGGGSGALATLMAAQAKLTPGRQTAEKPSAANSVTSWLWGRRAKPAAPTVTMAAATTSSSNAIHDISKTDKSGLPDGSSTGSLVSRRSSILSMKKPIASLSVTPATPSAATTSGAQMSSSPIQTKPIGMTTASAAFKVATNDIMSDPRSLEEHSLQQYFLEAARQNDVGTKNLKVNIEKEKSKRMSRLNPSNPSRSSVQLQDQSRRWLNIFPRAGRINNQRSVKWKSMCTPACLPLYSDYMPSFDELDESYIKDTYTLPVSQGMSSFLLRPGTDIAETAGNLLRELISQRLAQSFQIVLPPYEDAPRNTRRRSSNEDGLWTIPSAEDVRQILFNTPKGEGKAIFMGFSNTIHRLRFDRSSACINITSWKEKTTWQAKEVDYSFMLWPVGNETFQTSRVKFGYPDLATYDWRYMDRLVAGLEEPKLQEKTRYWRTRFALIPMDVPDLQGMIQSQSKILLDDSTEDDLRIAGVMTLYEQFSKARWQAQPKEKSRVQLVYSTTPYDPSIYAADEAERLKTESLEPPMPDAYGEDLFFEDLTPRELTRMIMNGQRPLRLQPRRSGFRRIEDSFTGQDFVTWLKDEFVDISDRATALSIGNDLVQKGVIVPLNPPKRLVDGYTFYQVAPEYRTGAAPVAAATAASQKFLGDPSEVLPSPSVNVHSQSVSYLDYSGDATNHSAAPAVRYTSDGRLIIPMSHSILINLDPHRKSDRRETAFLHFDAAHNTTNGFHFQLDWLGTSRLVEDLLSSWQRNMQKYGLKLVEENIRQVKDISVDNPLQAPEYIPLLVPPPEMPELEDILSKTVVAKDYFETQLLRDLGYVLDVEADGNFPPNVYPEYSYLKSPFDYSQFIHKSGSCFVQVLGGGRGYLFLKNRLYLSHRQQKRTNKPGGNATNGGGGTAPSTASMTASMMMMQGTGSYLTRTQSYYQAQQQQIQELTEPQALKRQLQEVCSSPDELNMRWENMMNAVLMIAAGNVGGGGSLSASGGSQSAAGTVAPSEPYSLRSGGRGPLRSLEPTPADHPLPASLGPSSIPPGSSLPGSSLPGSSLPSSSLRGEMYSTEP